MKFCKDCKHCVPEGWIFKNYRHAVCQRAPSLTDPVTGAAKRPPDFQCRFERSEHGACGPDAKHFEPHLPVRATG